MNHYCVVLLTVCAIVAYTSAAAATTTTAAPSGGNSLSTISGNVRHLIEQVVCAIKAFITLMQTIGGFGGGIGRIFINPWITGMQEGIRFLNQLIASNPFFLL